ncbi:MAG TPA: hypothetical protein VFS99_03195 [Xanthomonadaceae bacterium]|nr:hypothetical protein [Xanthomonadaceae bacterium]
MDWTPLEIERALLRLEDALPRLVAEHDDPRAFSAAVRRETADVEAHSGIFAPYVSRRIDALLVAMVRKGGDHSKASVLEPPRRRA